jgi:hypothetical protein
LKSLRADGLAPHFEIAFPICVGFLAFEARLNRLQQRIGEFTEGDARHLFCPSLRRRVFAFGELLACVCGP